MTTKKFLPGNRLVSSNGFSNFMGKAPTPQAVFQEYPDAVIVDGTDDWNVPLYARVQHRKAGVEILAVFHTGTSGMSMSGAVMDQENYARFKTWYEAEFGYPVTKYLRIFTQEGTK